MSSAAQRFSIGRKRSKPTGINSSACKEDSDKIDEHDQED